MLTNKHDRAKAAGLKSYDVALPQEWLDNEAKLLANESGRNVHDCYDLIRINTVWSYDDSPVFGRPYRLDPV